MMRRGSGGTVVTGRAWIGQCWNFIIWLRASFLHLSEISDFHHERQFAMPLFPVRSFHDPVLARGLDLVVDECRVNESDMAIRDHPNEVCLV
jgi:hypothetical protein